MRLVPLHNVLSSALRLLHAEAVAMRLLPGSGAWQPLDVAVGDTALLESLGWSEQGPQPGVPGVPLKRALLGIPDALDLFLDADAHAVAMRIDVSDQLLAAMPSQFKTFEKRGAKLEVLGTLWFAVVFKERTDPGHRFDYEPDTGALTELLIGVAAQALWGLYQSRQIQADPVTGLPGAEAFRERLRRPTDTASAGRSALFLLSIDGYAALRKNSGQERAEAALRDAAGLLENAVRKEDGLYCYREAQFAVLAQVQDEAGAHLLADKLEHAVAPLRTQTDLRGIGLSVGYVLPDADVANDPHSLSLAAEQALDYARLRGGQTSVAYTPALPDSELSQHHLASTLLTDPERGYRNNYILWQTLSLLAAETGPDELARQFAGLLEQRLDARQVLLLEEVGGTLQLLSSAEEDAGRHLGAAARGAVERALRSREVVSEEVIDTARELDGSAIIAIPLLARHQLQGCLLLTLSHAPDAADLLFLRTLADQVAGALDRAKLVLYSLALRERESEALRAQLTDLAPQAASPPPLKTQHSSAMREVMDFVDHVAPTDVSILVMGESGAGKEVMARTIHAASNRWAAPFVVVDCSAITPSLIESELFGRVKGAFTGADAASEGRIAQAHGGTLFLDEIGELPLDVQAKLLRFVQEKEVVAVGATETRRIDTRIICATNRDLQAEAQKGQFRADLYFRLQAIQVEVPPLRQRLDDLPDLVAHFVREFNARFDGRVGGLSEAAWLKLKTYPWPGNVRELENVIMRAVLMKKTGELQAEELVLSQSAALAPAQKASVPPQIEDMAEDPWSALEQLLDRQIDAVFPGGQPAVPLGRWLNELMVLSAWELNDCVVVAAARLLGLPETTLRRQLNRAQQHLDNPLAVRSTEWQADLPVLKEVLLRIMTDAQAPQALAEAVERCLVQRIAAAVDGDSQLGAVLLGVTPPTYVKRLEKLSSQLQAEVQAASRGGR